MRNQTGFTLIELILFIVITGLIASTLLLALITASKSTPIIQQQSIAAVTAQKCMEWFIGQRRLNNYSSVTCPSSTTPSFCSAPSGYSISTDISCTTVNSDTNYKTITITVSGKGDTSLSTLIADY